MSEPRLAATGNTLRSPRAAAVAGILFAVLYGAALVLVRQATDALAEFGSAWPAQARATASTALLLLPFSGIAFLWFIGVIRDRLGHLEDRFVSTVFLGSGLLFLAMTFAAGAIAGGLLAALASSPGLFAEGEVLSFVRGVTLQIMNLYAVRMEGVFMISAATIWVRTRAMPRGLAVLTYASAALLLISVSLSLWAVLVFPLWVLVISVYLLLVNAGGTKPAGV